ncbi:MAG: hypothetical protein JNM76_00500 [Betaproteobacteria bacterium]|nr:hypothetical protein [Betaproteobacteria bacterium]
MSIAGWLALLALVVWLLLLSNRRRFKSAWLRALLGVDGPNDMPESKMSSRETWGWFAVGALILMIFVYKLLV